VRCAVQSVDAVSDVVEEGQSADAVSGIAGAGQTADAVSGVVWVGQSADAVSDVAWAGQSADAVSGVAGAGQTTDVVSDWSRHDRPITAVAQPGERKVIVRRSGFVGRGRHRGVVRERRSERGGRAGGKVGRTIGGRTGLRFFVRSVGAGAAGIDRSRVGMYCCKYGQEQSGYTLLPV